MSYNPSKRIRFLSFAILFFGALIVTKLFYVQIIHGASYSQEADRQYVTPSGDIFDRGSIYFTQKDGTLVPAATLEAGFKVAIVPKDVTDVEGTYSAISAIVPIDHNTFVASAAKKTDPYEEIVTKITQEQADAIDALHLPGVSIYQQKWPFYPGGSLAAQTLGFVAYKGNDLSGRTGLERQYDTTLDRTEENTNVNFFAEVFSNLQNTFFKNNDTEGDIQTTIEPSVQEYLEKEMAGVQAAYSPDSMGGIIINPKTGAIYAMAALPNFDLNNFSQVTDPRVFSNPLVENVFEMGSVIKPLVMAAGIDEGVITPQTTYDDKGVVTVDGKKIYNFDKEGRGPNTTMQTVLNQSLNTGMVFVESKMGNTAMRNYMLGYGLGQKTGIDLPSETASLVSNLQSPRDIEYANAAFGQGIALTPIATVRAFSAIANGGTLITPHLVQKILYKDGGSSTPVYPTVPSKISAQAAATVAQMMTTVYDTSLVGGQYKIPHYSIAAKTGTAQIAKPNGGGYYDNEVLHSFFGFFPASNPQFLIFLYAVNPKGVEYAAYSLAQPFVDLTKYLINYYNVPPDR